MQKLHQIIALANGRKSRTQSAITQIYHKLQQSALFAGMKKSYQPKEEDGNIYPGEEQRLQLRAESLLTEASIEWSKLFNVVATQDEANTNASADVVVDGKIVIPNLPVSTLLFLEKQLADVKTALNHLPILDPAKEWSFSEGAGCFRSTPIQTTKTKKIPRFTVAYEATKEHPAQVDKDSEDVLEGYWTKVEFSGAITAARKTLLIERLDALADAVKIAREEANAIEAPPIVIGHGIFDYLLK